MVKWIKGNAVLSCVLLFSVLVVCVVVWFSRLEAAERLEVGTAVCEADCAGREGCRYFVGERPGNAFRQREPQRSRCGDGSIMQSL